MTTGRLTTLPSRLPQPGERPLTFLLGSCFYNRNDPGGRVDLAYRRLPAPLRPDFKILCGDQIYLDSPWFHFLRSTHSETQMRNRFFDRYWQTWAGTGAGPGLRRMLADGANFFCADDHELWNNAPTRATVVRDTWREAGRQRWKRTALSLYRVFQTPHPWARFDVSPLSFYVADTRLNRAGDDLMTAEQLGDLTDWIATLGGPGVLVLGQPLFAEPRGWRGALTDWTLPDYAQYATLTRALCRAPHSLVVLTGDVHYRRLARCQLPTGVELHEVISSPLTLVDKKAGGAWHAAPDRFPAASIPGVPRQRVSTGDELRRFEDHFLLFQCQAVGAGTRVNIFDFAVNRSAPAPGGSRPIAQLRLH